MCIYILYVYIYTSFSQEFGACLEIFYLLKSIMEYMVQNMQMVNIKIKTVTLLLQSLFFKM